VRVERRDGAGVAGWLIAGGAAGRSSTGDSPSACWAEGRGVEVRARRSDVAEAGSGADGGLVGEEPDCARAVVGRGAEVRCEDSAVKGKWRRGHLERGDLRAEGQERAQVRALLHERDVGAGGAAVVCGRGSPAAVDRDVVGDRRVGAAVVAVAARDVGGGGPEDGAFAALEDLVCALGVLDVAVGGGVLGVAAGGG